MGSRTRESEGVCGGGWLTEEPSIGASRIHNTPLTLQKREVYLGKGAGVPVS